MSHSQHLKCQILWQALDTIRFHNSTLNTLWKIAKFLKLSNAGRLISWMDNILRKNKWLPYFSE